MSIKLAIFDCDGTLVTTASGDTFRQTADDVQWLPGRKERLAALRASGVLIATASNQAGVAFPRSRFTEEQMEAVMKAFAEEIGATCYRVCYTTPNPKALPQYFRPGDPYRKPGPGMLLGIMDECGVTPHETLFVGDRPEDEQAARSAGCDFVHADLYFGEGESL